MAFFLDHAYLLMPAEGLEKFDVMASQPILDGGMEENLRKALGWSKDPPPLGEMNTCLQTAEASLDLAAFFLEEWQRWLSAETSTPGLDWNRLQVKNGAGGIADGYFTSRDGRMLFLFVHPKNPSGDFGTLGPVVDKVKQVSAALAEQAKAAGFTPPTVGLTGLPAIEYEEYVNIRKDITLVIFTSAGLIAALILLVVRSVRWAVLIFISMGLGVLWNLGLALVNVGQGRVRTESFLRALLSGAYDGLKIIGTWRLAETLTPEQLPPALCDRFFAADGSIAVSAFPVKTVYDPDNLDALIKDVYSVSPEATGFPTTHQGFSKAVVESFTCGTQLALALCLLWVMAATRSVRGFTLEVLPLLIGGGWTLGLMALGGIRYNYANIVALPLVIALAVDYGVWFSYRWGELKDSTRLQVSLAAGKVIGLAAGTELAGLGAITGGILARRKHHYRTVVLPDRYSYRGSGHRTIA